MYNAEVFVYVDETGSDRRDSMQKFGYGLRGTLCKAHKLTLRGTHVSAVSAISTCGVLNCHLFHGGVKVGRASPGIHNSNGRLC